jgi:hypothetical protein
MLEINNPSPALLRLKPEGLATRLLSTPPSYTYRPSILHDIYSRIMGTCPCHALFNPLYVYLL